MGHKLLEHLSTLLLLCTLCALTYLSFRAELGVRYFLAVSLVAAVAALIAIAGAQLAEYGNKWLSNRGRDRVNPN
jgi:hypothetical protein